MLLDALECDDAELSILLTGDKEIAKLNESYRKKKGPTDVLSFAFREGKSILPGGPLGDVIISLETAKRQASEFEVSFREEVLRLLVHGTLHLLGYDHEKVSAEKAKRMQRKEKGLYEKLFTPVVTPKGNVKRAP